MISEAKYKEILRRYFGTDCDYGEPINEYGEPLNEYND